MDKIIGQFEGLIEKPKIKKYYVFGDFNKTYIVKKKCIACRLKVPCLVLDEDENGHICKDCINNMFQRF
jgi:hypothetical protein